MIDLVFSNGQAFLWNAEDWLKLRQEHKIIGALVGCLTKMPRQEALHGLPMLLMPEEVTLLLEKKIARLIEIPCLQQKPSEELKKAFEDYRKMMFEEQEKCLSEERQKQVIEFMDKIIEGKRRKMLGLNTSKKKMKKSLDESTRENINDVEIDREALLAEELEKIPKLEPSEALIQTHTAYPWSTQEDIKEAQWNYPQTADEKLRSKVFKDLWEKGFYITYGSKFGGDFLAYPGDPILFHSHFIIICKDGNEEIPVLELSGQCRVACHVRKTQVYAYLDEDNESPVYQSFYFQSKNA